MSKIVFSEIAQKFPVKRLKKWFILNQRSFPWRDNASPYRVWVSEVMLQQTRAEVVVDYFLAWMRKFPTITSLAQAKEEEVIKAWEGLGYYSRARNLLAGARKIVQDYQGKIPEEAEELAKIKGLGPYTVNAILAFAFKRKVVAVDGNVLRVISRVLLLESSIDSPSTRKLISTFSQSLLPNKDPQIISEALIELGACICTRSPKCEICPIQNVCMAFQTGRQKDFPIRKTRKKTEVLYRWVAVILYKEMVFLEKRQPEERLAGLYEFPYKEVGGEEELQDKDLQKALEKDLHVQLEFVTQLEEIVHVFTHYKVRLFPRVYQTKTPPPMEGLYPLLGVNSLPFSSGHRKIKDWLIRKVI